MSARSWFEAADIICECAIAQGGAAGGGHEGKDDSPVGQDEDVKKFSYEFFFEIFFEFFPVILF